MKKKFVLIFFLFIFPEYVLQSEGEKVPEFIDNQIHSILFLTVGLPLSYESEEFFQKYSQILEGKKQAFETNILLSAGNKYQFWNKYRISTIVEIFYSELNDYYIQDYVTIDEKGIRIISQSIKINSIPIMLGFEYLPSDQQFRTYAGLALGVDFANLSWNEKLESTIINDHREGGKHFDKLIISPVFRTYGGIELGFDKRQQDMILGSFLLEFQFSYSLRKANIFSKINYQFKESKKGINDYITILPYYFGLNIGITFNFYGK